MNAPTVSEEGNPPTLEAGTVVAGRYRVLGKIGTGGMGAVYRAEHVHMRKVVALKVLHREFLKVDEVVARFEREAVAAARIEHPNVVAASDFGKLDDGSFYLVLEFVDGPTLRTLIEKGGALALGRTLKIAQQTVLALRAAHAAGIVHRDLKPDNVMLVTEPEGGDRVKVVDFGIARMAAPDASGDSKLTRAGVVMGTVAYMSPEQATGQAVDERADLYSLGVMLYEMIAGVVPFDAELPSQVLARQLVEKPPPLPLSTPPALAKLVLDLMEKKPEDRPSSAQEVLDRLGELTATPSGRVVAPRSGPPRVVLYAAGGAVVLFAVLGLALTGRSGEGGAASAEPPASTAPSAATDGKAKEAAPSEPPPAAGTPSALVVAPAPASASAAPPASAAARPASESAPKAARSSSKPAAKSTKSKAPQPASKSPPKRQTGPGGIYIPPPSQWFN